MIRENRRVAREYMDDGLLKRDIRIYDTVRLGRTTRETECYLKCAVCDIAQWDTMSAGSFWKCSLVRFPQRMSYCPEHAHLTRDMDRTIRMTFGQAIREIIDQLAARMNIVHTDGNTPDTGAIVKLVKGYEGFDVPWRDVYVYDRIRRKQRVVPQYYLKCAICGTGKWAYYTESKDWGRPAFNFPRDLLYCPAHKYIAESMDHVVSETFYPDALEMVKHLSQNIPSNIVDVQ